MQNLGFMNVSEAERAQVNFEKQKAKPKLAMLPFKDGMIFIHIAHVVLTIPSFVLYICI